MSDAVGDGLSWRLREGLASGIGVLGLRVHMGVSENRGTLFGGPCKGTLFYLGHIRGAPPMFGHAQINILEIPCRVLAVKIQRLVQINPGRGGLESKSSRFHRARGIMLSGKQAQKLDILVLLESLLQRCPLHTQSHSMSTTSIV